MPYEISYQPLILNGRNLGSDPANWPATYSDSNNLHILRCQCEGTVIGGWDSSPTLVTQAQCSAIAGGWSASGIPYYDATPDSLGFCGGPLNTDCNTYYRITSYSGVSAVPFQYQYLTFPPNLPYYAGSISVDPCDLSYSIPAGSGLGTPNLGVTNIDYNVSRESLINNCYAMASVLPGCNPRMGYYAFPRHIPAASGITITDTYDSTPTDTPWWQNPVIFIGGIGVIGGAAGAGYATYNWWNNRPRPPQSPPGNGYMGTDPAWSATQTAKDCLEKLKQLGVISADAIVSLTIVGVGIGIAVTAPELALATILVVIYNEDGSEATSFVVEVPFSQNSVSY